MKIVVALDRSEFAEIVLEHAIDQAVRDPSPELHFLTVVNAGDDLDEAKNKLAALVLPALDIPGTDWQARLHVRAGNADDAIAELALDLDADLVVVGRFGLHHGKHRHSVASRVIDAVTCPVLAVRLRDHAPATPTCPDCASVRAVSDGERWFCAAHAGDRVSLRVSSLTTTPTGGGLLL